MKTTRTLVIAVALVAVVLAVTAGCNSAQSTEPTQAVTQPESKPPADMGTLVAFRNAKGELVCPVQGDVIPDAEKSAGFQDYKDMRYYFCCAGCPEAFAADPEKYIKK
jgi:YHS domain-containing protein